MQLIAEVKRLSFQRGNQYGRESGSASQVLSSRGCGMISVLTDPVFFKGSIEDLREVAKMWEFLYSVKISLLVKNN
ncbi:hypothetical protein GCM10027614_84260 [Micromonospora vulcania]